MSSKNVVDLRKRTHGGARGNVSSGSLRSATARSRENFQQKIFVSPKKHSPALPARRVSPLRTQRRKVRFWLFLTVLVLGSGFAYAVSAVSYLPQYNISSVRVMGTNKVPTALVSNYAQTLIYTGDHPFISPTNIFIFDTKAFARSISGFFPRIRSVSVNRSALLATTLVVEVTERQPFARWCAGKVATSSACFLMDDTGFLFAPVQTTATSTLPYVFSGGIATSSGYIGSSFVPAHLPGLRTLFDQLSQANYTPLGAVVFNDRDFSIPLFQGYDLKVSYGEDPSIIVRDLKLVLSSSALQNKVNALEYIDLRFGDRAYFKLKGDIGKTPAQ